MTTTATRSARTFGVVPTRWASLFARLAKFGVVGGFAYVVDVTLFNLLLYVGERPLLGGLPIVAKIVGTTVATVVSWLGNRHWTFRGRQRDHAGTEFVFFALACTTGLALTLLTLWVSHYVLGFTSPLADNVAANLVGVALGTGFRFFAYSSFVFVGGAPPEAAPVLDRGADRTSEPAASRSDA